MPNIKLKIQAQIALLKAVGLIASLFLFSDSVLGLQEHKRFQTAFRYSVSGLLAGEISPSKDGNQKYTAKRYLYEMEDRPSLLTAIEFGVLNSWESEQTDPSDWSSFTIEYVDRMTYDDYGQLEFKGVTSGDGTYRELKQFSYDVKGRVECETQRMNETSLSPENYSQTACEISNSEGSYGADRITKYVYDDLNNITNVIKAFGTELAQEYASYEYNGYRKESVTDANGNLTKYEYDLLSRVNKTCFPHKETSNRGQYNPADCEEYTYDRNGNKTYFKSRSGKEFFYYYDSLNRMTYKDDKSTSLKDTFYEYNLLGNPRQISFGNYDSKLITGNSLYYRSNGFGEINVEYSEFGIGHENNYLYDVNGNRYLRWTGTPYVSFQLYSIYNDRDQLTNVLDYNPFGGEYIRIDYSDFGEVYNVKSGNSYVGIDFDRRKLTTIYNNFSGTNYDLLQSFSHSPAGQVVGKGTSNSNYIHRGSIGQTGSYTVNGLNQYRNVSGNVYTYDNDGNLQSDGINNFVYDSENRLVEVHGEVDIYLEYDPLGRLYLVQGNENRYFTYDGDKISTEFINSSDQHAYIYGQGNAPALDFHSNGSSWYGLSFAKDHQDSVIAAADLSGMVENGYVNTYDPYGVPSNANMGSFGYTGQIWLPEIELYYYRARFYDPKIGRFLQTDPIGYEDQMNLYAYVYNDPMNVTDSTGMCGGGWCVAGAIIVGRAIISYAAKRAAQKAAMNLANATIATAVVVTANEILNESSDSGATENKGQKKPEVGDCPDCGGDTSNKEGKIGQKWGIGKKETGKRIHGLKNKAKITGNPDIEVCNDCGEVFPQTPDGELGESIGNIEEDFK